MKDRWSRLGWALALAIPLAALAVRWWTKPRPSPAPPEVLDWLKTNAIPLKTVEPGNGSEDLQPLKRVVGNARIVALGEATHGSREFFRFKHRMVEFLVEEMGFTAFAIEGSACSATRINDYVLEGKGDAAAALAGLNSWPWDTLEVLEMIRWMRRYNEDPTHRNRIRFYGFDLSHRVDLEEAKRFLASIDAPAAAQLGTNPSDDAIRAVLERATEHKEKYLLRSSRDEWARAVQSLRGLQQERQAAQFPPQDHRGNELRDRLMADNVQWILETEGAASRIVLWAHNMHVSLFTWAVACAWSSMGAHLRHRYGPDYLALGFAFHRGSFQAIDWTDPSEPSEGLTAFTVGPAPEGTVSAALTKVGLPLFLIDLRSAPSSGPVAQWLETEHPERDIGATFHKTWDTLAQLPRFVPRRMFDAVIFVETTSRTTPNPTALQLTAGFKRSGGK